MGSSTINTQFVEAPVPHAGSVDLLVSVLGDLDLPGKSIALCPAGYVDCVAEQTKSRHLAPNDTSHHGTTVDTNAHLWKTGRRLLTLILHTLGGCIAFLQMSALNLTLCGP